MTDEGAKTNREGKATIAPSPCPRGRPRVTVARFPNADEVARGRLEIRPRSAVDVLFVNPPAPDGGIWIRSQHRVGRRSREGMIWPQVSLAQMAALLAPNYSVEVIDAIADRMTWPQFEALLREKRPRYYVTQVTGPTLQNDMYGCFLACSLGARTIAFGTHVTPMTRETMEPYPSLDFVLRGEPELTLVELIETLESSILYPPSSILHPLSAIRGLVWRRNGEIVINPDRPFIKNLDDLPLPRHDLLPLDRYRIPMVKGPYTFVVTSRGCPAGCNFCIKHVNYQYSVRIRSPENIIQELWLLHDLGIHNIHMYADLFTVNRDQVIGLCNLILEEGLRIRWTCNSRVDFVDEEMLGLMGRSGCWMISWGIESANEGILQRVRKGYRPEQAAQALRWARAAGIKNWGYFIIGLPGETEETIQQTIQFSKSLPLDLALFHIAAPHPGTPFFFEVVEKGWFRPGTRWEEVDMDRSTVLDYPGLPAERIEYWARRAFREWAFRPGPVWTYLTNMVSPTTFRSALEIGLETLGWARG
jgi:anaerobic magnesium-protoporphyrin IX monomethyl ester cyclase